MKYGGGNWSIEIATEYLQDYFHVKSFVGFVIEEEEKIIGGIFGHEKIWWNNNEVYIDEMFVYPDLQRRGYGNKLLKKMEEYVATNKLAGMTLLTNRFSFAPDFYKNNGFGEGEHILFMYKTIE